MILNTFVLSLLAVFLSAEAVEQRDVQEQQEAKIVEAQDGCGCGKPACFNPVVRFQNYQDVNVDVLEYYNYETSFPYVGPEDYSWTLDTSGSSTYNNGEFISVQDPVILTRNELLDLAGEGLPIATYISAQLDFEASNPVNITSPLGVDSDPFYGYGFLNTQDGTVTGLQYAFALTNDTVYAIYGRDNFFQTPNNDYIAFKYLVPLQPRQAVSIYTLIFNPAEMTVSWMIDGSIRMVIPTSGKLIDERFMIEDFGGAWAHPAYPASVTVSMGLSKLTVGSPNTACQEALFNYCDRSQSIFNAANVQCTYEPIQDPEYYSVEDMMMVSMFSITQASAMKPACSCPCVAC